MKSEHPFGVKWMIGVNALTAVALVIFGVGCALVFIPNFYAAAEQAGETVNLFFLVVGSIAAFSLGVVPAAFLIRLNRYINDLKPVARRWQYLVSILGLAVFVPFGTAFHLFTLGLLLFSEKTKAAFEGKSS